MSEFVTDVSTNEYTGDSFRFRRENIMNNLNSDVSIRNEMITALATNINNIIKKSPQRNFDENPIRILDVGTNDADTMIGLVDHLAESGCDAPLDLVLIEPAASLDIPEWFVDQDIEDGFSSKVYPSEFNYSLVDDLSDDYGHQSFDIINLGFVIYHLDSEKFVLDAANKLITTDPNSGYLVVTNVGDQYMAPIVNIEANRGFSSQSNSLMSEIIVDDENETFYASSVRVYKSTVQFGSNVISEYEDKHSMFKRIHDSNGESDSSYFNSNWKDENPDGIAMLDFRIDMYRRNLKKDD